MKIIQTRFADVRILVPTKHADERGFFSETFSQRELAKAGMLLDFVQDNHAYSKHAATVRGLHFQIPPFAQDKLVRVVRGAILDVIVDLRHGSPTFGQHIIVEISAQDWKQIFIPAGFAHGLCTLEPDTEVLYKVTNFYSPAHDKGVRWDDTSLGIEWPFAPDRIVMSEKDRSLPRLSELPSYFAYSEVEPRQVASL